VEAFKAIHPLDAGRLAGMQPAGPVRGHPLHTDLSATQTHGERVLVVGDAAGLVGPFTGEGIAAAMRSAERAADSVWKALCAGDFSAKVFAPYTQALRQRYLADQKAARTLRSLLRLPALLNRFIRNLREDEIMARLFAEIYLDERSPRLLLKPGNILRSMF
jgi:flavin-dependent dehydrogenase